MKRCLLLVLFVAALSASAAPLWADEKLPLPSGPPPLFGLASALVMDEKEVLELTAPSFVPRQETVIVERDGKKIKEVRTVMEQVYVTRRLLLDGKSAVVFDPAGKRLTRKEIVKRLEKSTPVLISPTAKIDPFHKKFLRDDLLIVTGSSVMLSGAPLPVPPKD